MVAEAQKLKHFGDQMSPLPDNSNMPVHAVEILRQVLNSSAPRGGWVGDDAWFRSAHTCVLVIKRLGAHSTWIAKNNSTFFPQRPLLAVLRRGMN